MPKVCPVCGVSYTDGNIFCPTDGSTLRAGDSEGDLIGTVVADRYLVTDLLGEGGMGKVYLARHVRLPQQAAIKVLRPAMLRDMAAVARFNQEAANASRIEHEHIARVFDYGESSDGTVYLAMEYVPGRTLKSIIAKDGAQSPARTATITRQIGDALDAAHRLNIVHRDLKPDNVMVIEDEELGDRCKVVDFGIAKAIGGATGEQGLTKTGFVVGTPEYMSPEQLLGGTIDHRSDVYALALVSFHCLTGVLPFEGSTPERAMTARLVEAPRPLSAVRSDIAWPADVQAVFDRGLARSVEDRYDRAGTFARELEAAITRWINSAAETREATPPSAARVASATPARARPTAAAASPAGAKPVTPVRTAGVTPTHAPSRMPLIVGGLLGVVGIAAVSLVLLRPGADGASPAPTNTASADSSTNAGEDISPGNTFGGATIPDRQTDSSASNRGVTPPDSGTSTPDNSIKEKTQSRQQTGRTTPSERLAIDSPPAPIAAPTARETSAAALASLDSIRNSLDPLVATPADARRGIAALRQLMPRLATAEDSAWGYIRQAEAHFIAEDERSACLALREARPRVRSGAQREILTLMTGALSVTC